MACIPILQTKTARHFFRFCPTCNGLNQSERHRHRGTDASGCGYTSINHYAPICHIKDGGMLIAKLLTIEPVGRRPLAIKQPRSSDHLSTRANTHDKSTLGRLLLQPLHNYRVIITAHGRNNDIIGTLRMSCIKFRHSGLRFNRQRRIKFYRPRPCGKHYHIRNISTP